MIAALSGLVCFLVYDIPSGQLPGSTTPFHFLVFGALVGLPFSAGVLFPYLRHEKWMLLRGAALVLISGLSFQSAIAVVAASYGKTWSWGSPGIMLFVAASLVGAGIVLTGARYVIPLNNFSTQLIVGLIAAIPGGLIFAALAEEQWYLAFAAWHVLMAASIHFAEGEDLRAWWAVRSKGIFRG